jgi:hypothetical protein
MARVFVRFRCMLMFQGSAMLGPILRLHLSVGIMIMS